MTDRNEKARDKIKEMANAKCVYPECGKKQLMSVSLPVLVKTETGISPAGAETQSMGIPVPLCAYHFPIASMGLFGVLQHDDKMEKLSFHAPFEMIAVAEAVFEAKRMEKEFAGDKDVKKQ